MVESCLADVQEAPGYLLSVAGVVFASLLAVTLSSWRRDAAKNKARDARALSDEATAAAKRRQAKTYPEFTMDAVHKHCTANDAWVVIGDGVYDVGKWAPHHPGGERNIVDISGRDVTDVFEAFHREPRHRQKLEGFRIGTLVGYTPSPLVQDFRALGQEIDDEGLFEIDPWFFIKRYIVLLPILALGAYIVITYRGCTGIQLSGAGLVGFYWQQLAFLGHDAGHRSHTADRASDDFTAYCLILPLLGIGPQWWIDSHNIHHVVCNDVHCDPDIQHLPFMAISPKFFASLYSVYHDKIMVYDFLGRCLVSVQHLLFYPLMCVSRTFLYVQSIVFVLAKARAKKRVHELLSYVVFFCWNAYLCSHLEGAWPRASYFLVSHAVSGILHVQITLSHFSMDVTEQPQYRNDEEGWVVTQLNTTLDVDCYRWMDWFHGGLQFQTLHHLFPKLPRYNLRTVQSRVAALAEKHGLTYHLYPFLQANIKTYLAMRETARQAWTKPNFKFTDSMLYEGASLVG
ncbi:unnamed protein product [Ectocarpus sp. 12 AP-2014]